MPVGAPAGILSELKRLSPNMSILGQNNELEITIPKEDIINAVKQGIPENIRPYIDVLYTDKGIIMKIRLV
jgi:hypothetical protein